MLKQLVCLAAGVGIGYYIHQYQSEKTFQDRLDKARDDIKLELDDQYQRKVAELMKQYEEDAADIPEVSIPTPEPMPAVVAKAMTDYAGISRIPPTAFAKDFHVEGESEDKVADFIPDAEEDRPEFLKEVPEPPTADDFVEDEVPPRLAFVPPSRNPVQIVDESVFIENEDGYSEYTLEFWAGNVVLTNEQGEPFDDKNRDRILGEEGLKMLTGTREALAGNNLYIRHTGLKSVFEIIPNDDAFEGA